MNRDEVLVILRQHADSDAEGHRVAKGTITPQTGNWCDLQTNSFVLTSRYVLNLNGETLTEFSNNGSSHSDIPLADGVGATLTADANTQTVTHFQFTDWLGTRRVQTDALGSPEEICSGGAFGDAVNCLGEAATDRHFTGKERDAETSSVPGRNDGLDYFGARYYSSNLGRWMSPDWDEKPEAVPYSSLTHPQTLNLYGYLRGNPLAGIDPDGHSFNTDEAEQRYLGFITGIQHSPNTPATQQHSAQQNNATTLPTGTQLTMVQTLMGEQTGEASVGTNQYGDDQSGRNAGPPTGAQITDATLDKEASLMAGTMLNLGHIGDAKTYRGLPAGKHLTALAAKAKPGSALATQLQRDMGAVRNATPSPYSQWRAVNQGFIRSRGDALRVAGTDFLP